MRDRNRSAHHQRDIEGVHELLPRNAISGALFDVIGDAVIATQDDRADQSHQLFSSLIEGAVFIGLGIKSEKSLDAEVAAVQKFFVHLAAVAIEFIHDDTPFTTVLLRFGCSLAIYHKSQPIAGSADVSSAGRLTQVSGAADIRAASNADGTSALPAEQGLYLIGCSYAGILALCLYNSNSMSGSEPQHESPTVDPAAGAAPDEPQLYDLVPFVAADRVFAVFADQVDGTAEARIPAALPNAPATVLGIVSMRGHMLTVLDPVAVLTGETLGWPECLPAVIALRGDEQLALAAHSCRDTITIAAEDIQPSSQINEDGFENAVLGIARYGGEEVTVLRVDRLFAAAVRRKERRRRRI